jgi:hypothetical protein
MQCISESFSVEWSADSPNSYLSVKPSSLLSIFEVFLKTQQKIVRVQTPSVELDWVACLANKIDLSIYSLPSSGEHSSRFFFISTRSKHLSN